MSTTTNSSMTNHSDSPLNNTTKVKTYPQNLLPKEIYLYKLVNGFYNHCDKSNIDRVVLIINEQSKISLRVLDWFVTSYANRKKISLDIDDDMIDVHISYKAQLKSYKKHYFDPFKRKTSFDYTFKNTTHIVTTTIGQLNFFRWAIEYKILDYVDKHFDVITKEMKVSNRNNKRKKTEKSIAQMVIPQKGMKNNIIGINVTKKGELEDECKIILSFD